MIRPWLVLLIDQASLVGQILIRQMDPRRERQEVLDHRGHLYRLYRLCLRVVPGTHQTAAPQSNQLY
jgi:hypothetical protein